MQSRCDFTNFAFFSSNQSCQNLNAVKPLQFNDFSRQIKIVLQLNTAMPFWFHEFSRIFTNRISFGILLYFHDFFFSSYFPRSFRSSLHQFTWPLPMADSRPIPGCVCLSPTTIPTLGIPDGALAQSSSVCYPLCLNEVQHWDR